MYCTQNMQNGLTRAGKNRFESICSGEWVVFDSVQFDYTIHISDITMFGN